MKRLFCIALGALLCTMVQADTAQPIDDTVSINQANSNADQIAAQAKAQISQQQQVVSQRLQALSAAMAAQLPDEPTTPIVQQPVAPPPAAQPATAPQTTAPATNNQTAPQAPSTQQSNVTGLPRSSSGNSSNSWDYGF